MTDLDELRRIAYGRTSSASEEAAAAMARVQLAAVTSRVEPVDTPPAEEPDQGVDDADSPDDALRQAQRPEPGYLRRLATSWRAWIVPAAVAFVAGIAVAAASGVLVVNSMRFGDGSSAITPGTNTSERFQEGSTVVEIPEPVPGDVEAAREVLARPQEPDDTFTGVAPDVIPESTRLVYASITELGYAASSADFEFCFVVQDLTEGMTWMTCSPEDSFADQGITIGVLQSIGEKLTLVWNGSSVVATHTSN